MGFLLLHSKAMQADMTSMAIEVKHMFPQFVVPGLLYMTAHAYDNVDNQNVK